MSSLTHKGKASDHAPVASVNANNSTISSATSNASLGFLSVSAV